MYSESFSPINGLISSFVEVLATSILVTVWVNENFEILAVDFGCCWLIFTWLINATNITASRVLAMKISYGEHSVIGNWLPFLAKTDPLKVSKTHLSNAFWLCDFHSLVRKINMNYILNDFSLFLLFYTSWDYLTSK